MLTDVPQVRDLTTPIVLDGLNCRSNENRLDECQHLDVVEQCTHSDDAGANCTVIIGWQYYNHHSIMFKYTLPSQNARMVMFGWFKVMEMQRMKDELNTAVEVDGLWCAMTPGTITMLG